MSIIEILKAKGIKINVLDNAGTYLRAMWETSFLNDIDKTIKKSIYLESYLWHIFSYEKIQCLKEKDARIAFEQIRKKKCYVFYQHYDDVLELENAELIKAEDLDDEQDIYVVDTEFNWIYVHTHESSCGPYFYERSVYNKIYK